MKKVHATFALLVFAVLALTWFGVLLEDPKLEDVVIPTLIDTLPVYNAPWHKASVSLGDYNNDGRVDIFVTTNARGYIYKNTDYSFERVSDEEAGAAFEYVHMGLWGDIDNDGCKDLFVTRQSRFKYGIYRNNCDGSFEDVSQRIQPSVSVNGFGASFVDIDHDGLLDVFAVSFDRDNHKNFSTSATSVIDYANPGTGFNPVIFKEDNTFLVQKDGLFIQDPSASVEVLKGDVFGSRVCAQVGDVTNDSGRQLGPKFGFKQGYQPVWFDADGDGLLDVWVTYDFGFATLYRQTSRGVFSDVTESSGLCRLGNAMGVAVGDVDNDGDFDVYETNVGSNYLFINDGKGVFEEKGAEARVIDYENSGWGTSFADFNNDTALDIIVSNGREVEPFWKYDELDKLFLNERDGTFAELPIDHTALFNIKKRSLQFNADAAAATGDLNSDGFPDAVIFRPHTGAFYALYGKPNGNHWLSISLKGTTNNREGIGATVVVESGGVRQTRVVTAGTSYLSQDDTRQLFGLGKRGHVDAVEVSWPNGASDVYREITANQHIELKEGSGE